MSKKFSSSFSVQSFISLVLLSAITISCTGNKGEWHTIQGGAWNTTYTIKYKGTSDLTDSIIATINEIDRTFSPFNPNSLVTAINNNGEYILTADFIKVFEKSREISETSGGSFDPTVEPLLSLWGFGAERKSMSPGPDSEEIDSAIALVGITDCLIDGDYIIKKNPATRFNFSAIAKGFGCDKIAEMMLLNDIESFMIEIGGEIRVCGKNPKDKDWVIQIDAPISIEESQGRRSGLLKIAATDCGIATSGNYRNSRQLADGSKAWHTINPSTGYPNITSVLSVTIIAPTTMDADGYATAVMSMKEGDAFEMLSGLTDISAMLVLSRDYDTASLPSRGWKQLPSNGEYLIVAKDNFPPIVK